MKVYRLVGQAVCNYVTAFKMKLYRFPCFSKEKKKKEEKQKKQERKESEQKFCVTHSQVLWTKWYLSGTSSTLMHRPGKERNKFTK